MIILWLVLPQTKVGSVPFDSPSTIATGPHHSQTSHTALSVDMQGAQLVFERFIVPFLKQYASHIDPVFKTTDQASALLLDPLFHDCAFSWEPGQTATKLQGTYLLWKMTLKLTVSALGAK